MENPKYHSFHRYYVLYC